MSKPFVALTSLVIVAISTSGYAYSSVSNNYLHLFLIVPIIGLMFYGIYYSKLGLVWKSIHSFFFYLFCLSSSFVSTIANASTENLSSMVKFWLVVTFAYLFTCFVRPGFAARCFVYIFAGIVSISLFAYALENILSASLPLPTFTNVNGYPYKGAIVFFLYDNFLIFRNIGPFWEPGIFATYLTMALIISISIVHKKKLLIWSIFVVGLISTFSTASILFLIMIPAYWMSLLSKDRLKTGLVLLSGFSLMVAVYLNLSFLLNTLFEIVPFQFAKFAAEDSISLDARLFSPATNLEIFFEKPFLGHGFDGHMSKYWVNISSSQTSTSTAFLAVMGIPGIFYSLIWLVGFAKLNIPFASKTILFVFIFSALNKEPHTFFTITYICLFYLLRVGAHTESRRMRQRKDIKALLHLSSQSMNIRY